MTTWWRVWSGTAGYSWGNQLTSASCRPPIDNWLAPPRLRNNSSLRVRLREVVADEQQRLIPSSRAGADETVAKLEIGGMTHRLAKFRRGLDRGVTHFTGNVDFLGADLVQKKLDHVTRLRQDFGRRSSGTAQRSRARQSEDRFEPNDWTKSHAIGRLIDRCRETLVASLPIENSDDRRGIYEHQSSPHKSSVNFFISKLGSTGPIASTMAQIGFNGSCSGARLRILSISCCSAALTASVLVRAPVNACTWVASSSTSSSRM